MPFSLPTALAVIGAFILQKLILDVWFSKRLFGNVWAKYAHADEKKMDELKHSKVLHEAEIPARFAFMVFLAIILYSLGVRDWVSGVSYSLLIWIGVVETQRLIAYAWAQKDLRLWVVEAGCEGLICVVSGAIFGTWVR